MKLFLILFISGITGCATLGLNSNKLIVGCSEGESCHEKAANMCSNGYHVVSSMPTNSDRWSGNSPRRQTMEIRCK